MESTIAQPEASPCTPGGYLPRYWFGAALGFFLLAALFGGVLRLLYLVEIPGLDYKNLLHAHSHLALLGWGFTALSGGLLFLLLGQSGSWRYYGRLLALQVVAGLGMAIFYSYQGYGPISIFFSTLHLLAAYGFAYRFLRDSRRLPKGTSRRLAQWSIYWMLLSTVGLLAVGPIGATLGKLHPLYHASIQFFLHFQFNGWFTYAVLALLIHHFARRGQPIELKPAVFWVLQLSLLLTYALSITWSTPETILFYLNSAGVILQALAFGFILVPLLRAHRRVARRDIASVLLWVGLFSLVLKIAAQTAVAIPAIAEISYTIRNLVIGFIHLTMLGFISLTLLGLLARAGFLPTGKPARIGYGMLILAFLATEALLFGQGVLLWFAAGFLPGYHQMICWTSALLPLALALIAGRYISFASAKPVGGRVYSTPLPATTTKSKL